MLLVGLLHTSLDTFGDMLTAPKVIPTESAHRGYDRAHQCRLAGHCDAHRLWRVQALDEGRERGAVHPSSRRWHLARLVPVSGKAGGSLDASVYELVEAFHFHINTQQGKVGPAQLRRS